MIVAGLRASFNIFYEYTQMAAFKQTVSNSSCKEVKKREFYSTEGQCSGFLKVKKQVCKQLPRGFLQNRSFENFRKFPEIFCAGVYFLIKLQV